MMVDAWVWGRCLLFFCLVSPAASALQPSPIDGSGWPLKFPAKEHCSRCGLCETTYVSRVKDACAFLDEGMGRMDQLEDKVHGRKRNVNSMLWGDSVGAAEEARFGVLYEPMRLAQGVGMDGAQWTGVVTSISLSMFESNLVDAVVCIAAKEGDSWSTPEPIVAKTAQDILRGRGVKPALAPSLSVLDQIKQDDSIKRLLFCGVGCAVQAFRAVQDDLGLEDVYVLGTNCVDNSPTPEAADRFLRDGFGVPEDSKPLGYEFMQDYRVHVKTSDDYLTKPYFALPGTIAEQSIAQSCLACFDYTNGLADVVVGYMGAPLTSNIPMTASPQTLTIRNERGSKMVQAAVDAGRLDLGNVCTGEGAHEKLAGATVESDALIQAMIGVKPREAGMPVWMGEILAFLLRNTGPKGVSFARYSIDYHILRNYLHVLDVWDEQRAETSMPLFAKAIVDHYLSSDEKFRKLRSQIVDKKQ
jgi:coenzyme F420-reducing hydrogenase beta subunit